jgi:hypothetical protein
MSFLERIKSFFAPKPESERSFGGAGATDTWEMPAPVPGKPLPRGLRNFNPGNIRGTANGKLLAYWQGQTGVDRDGFCIFASPELGLRALGVLLLNYQRNHGLYSIDGIISRYAPGTENNTAAYVKAVSNAVGRDPHEPIDLRTNRVLLGNVMRAIVQHENGKQPYPPSVIATAVGMALPE